MKTVSQTNIMLTNNSFLSCGEMPYGTNSESRVLQYNVRGVEPKFLFMETYAFETFETVFYF
jgi:hypothetical protein